jgi:hypothetical protein
MNKKYFNGKYNLILLSKYNIDKLPDNVIVREGTLQDITFQIKSEEINNDEIFNGNLIVNSDYSEFDFEKIFSLPLDDNWLYTANFKHNPNQVSCLLEDKLWYCGSFVLWILGNEYRTENTLYGSCRVHRISLKLIDKSYYKKLNLVEKWDLNEVL